MKKIICTKALNYPLEENIDWTKLNASFFEHVFPSVKGHAALVDKYLSDLRAEYYRTVTQFEIKFNDEEATDPDWRGKRY